MPDRLFSKVLVANRGEIAIRIFRTCREQGIETVAVFSEADRQAPHVAAAGEAYAIGPPPARDSYLVVDNILEAARVSEADAIHPGYGFLAENADFAQSVIDAGLTWIGPPPAAMRLLGDKTAARKVAIEHHVPVVPGTPEPVVSTEEAIAAAVGIGYPVLLKAAAGGGGKGMRVVEAAEDLEAAFRMASSEAGSAFGDDSVYIEKYIARPRHIEIQVMADVHGKCLWYGERECSVQRRHQKIIEETPSPALDPEMRTKIGAAAVELASASGYVGAGTVEFLLEKDQFYFLEVNARLQVEHPVTEMVTGRDLVLDQLNIAAGRPLDLVQEDVQPQGHAIEVRVYAEDPENNFFPSPGTITLIDPPAGQGVRHDSGVTAGSEVTLYYDPLIAKLITWAPDRPAAIRRMQRALDEYQITGVTTIIPILGEILLQESFLSGEYDTTIVPQMQKERKMGHSESDDETVFLAALSAALFHTVTGSGFLKDRECQTKPSLSPWVEKGRGERQWRR
ncbi:acetyl/propionyl/methylcrotonyl-CoA carboxylase subunit alpha [Candidatus Zixiibacteriota bacterium]